MNSQNKSDKPNLTFWQMVSSVLASYFGVQSKENRERDFTRGKARQFIMVGILMTIVWYGVIWVVVNIVLHK